jgi:hypothetical protein
VLTDTMMGSVIWFSAGPIISYVSLTIVYCGLVIIVLQFVL